MFYKQASNHLTVVFRRVLSIKVKKYIKIKVKNC